MERDILAFEMLTNTFISTHTLTWSVTGAYDSMTDTFNNFNSHAHVERDLILLLIIIDLLNFNSHAHVERDQLNSYLLCAKLNFNSHAHVERDT